MINGYRLFCREKPGPLQAQALNAQLEALYEAWEALCE